MASRALTSRVSASRRDFFKAGGGLLIGFSLTSSGVLPQLAAANPAPSRLDAWLRIGADGTVRVFTGKVDIGMGVQTALTQVVAEELDVAPERVHLIMGDTAATPDQGGVGGSTSISAGARPLRNAAATARLLLLQLAATRLGAPVEQLQVKNGIVSRKDAAPGSSTYASVSYASLAGAQDLNDTLRVSGGGFAINVEGSGKPKDPATYTIVGQSLPRVDLAPKILGRAVYSTDVRVPGMLHGRVIRPAGAGAALQSVDESAVKAIPGYVKTVVKGNFVGVLAENEWAAIRAAKELKVTWGSPAAAFPSDVYAHMRAAKPIATRQLTAQGDAAALSRAALSGAAKKLEASYEWPFQSHATMGPGCAVADVKGADGKTDRVTTVWTGAQKPHALQKGLAQMLRVPEDQVRVVWVEAAGSYGRAGDEDVAADAALLSQAAGKPVRVQWSRADMTAWGGKGPAAIVDLAAALDAQGAVTALELTSRAFSGTEIIPQPNTAGNMLAAQLIGMPNTNPGEEYVQWGGSTYAYTIPNVHVTGHIIAPLYESQSPLRTTHLRDPNGPAGTFAAESFMDELAAAAGADPIEFRLRHTADPRAHAVLRAAAERARWDTRPSPKRGGSGPREDKGAGTSVSIGRGIALALRAGTYVATVAEVEVDTRTGVVRVKRLVCAHDCGLIVNPGALRGTIQANLIQSLGRTLKEEVTFDQTHVTSVDWNTYPVARWSDIPEVEVILLNHPEIAPSGAGEPSSRPTPAAINNAIFDATGVRLRCVPLTPDRVKAALG
ncbi:MAG TPA: molybdopterin cofactor-binding domain-containing protein [Candidatus Acidoferrales bacterium]|jgi:nicotinate dehydrogenase subunit B|nr:molybdopterin cofactor-binding domain-containing protein [Candidatus Acidoferrales bacterium]